jgi:SSS family solute:Na+ symporter
MPLYQLLIAFVFFVGFAAVLKVPELRRGRPTRAADRAKRAFPQWFVG